MDRRTRRRRIRLRDNVRQTLTVIAVGVSLGVALFAAGRYVTAFQETSVPAAVAGQGGEAYAGSILYMPKEGRNCHQLMFDNQSGRFTDNGEVDCANAAYHSPTEPKLWSSARARVIGNGFRDR